MTENAPTRAAKPTRYLLGTELLSRRKDAGLTQEALAELASTPENRITQNRIAHWERGDDGCGVETIVALAAVLGCEMHDLMHEDGVKAFTRLAEAIQSAPGAVTATAA